ncbi:exonuclease V [Staphylotrichum tortipilum]|uniref:Exonuclease V n=1 Tax=Staphylotrichum tortipilum TaxID=2831512 RepID=A0AAN6RQT5_9PEZI|nr:exonuclease V [Staphylotrichum longicolle]
MAGFDSDSDGGYAYDLTASDEEKVWAEVDPFSAAPTTPRRTTSPLAPGSALLSSPFSPNLDPDAALAVEETIAALTDDDLSFDISELQDQDASPPHGQGAPPPLHRDILRTSSRSNSSRSSSSSSSSNSSGIPARKQSTRLAPVFARDARHLASFVAKSKPKSTPSLLPGPDVRYPDLSRALSDATDAVRLNAAPPDLAPDAAQSDQSPLLRFRSYPMKPLSVTDLTAGAWCELQHYYALTRLPGGRKTQTKAMKRGSNLHQNLELQLFKPVRIEIAKKEDNFALKIWNMIQGLRVLVEQGFTREFEVWGMVNGNLVCGVIDGLSYDNPDEELEEDVLSSRGGSQITADSEPYEPSAKGDHQVFITDIKTRRTPNPPPQMQVRSSILQLFLYHRFLCDMADNQLDYMRVFERYRLNPDEPFSDTFMAQIGNLHDEIFPSTDDESDSILSDGTADGDGNGAEFVSAPSSTSQVSFADDESIASTAPQMKYRTLRSLVTLLKSELRAVFPRGAADIGSIVAVEYRYRGRDEPPPPPDAREQQQDQQQQQDQTKAQPQQPPSSPEHASIICTNTFFVEPDTLDLFLFETMAWWTGARPPRGVPPEEAGLKCQSCEFRDVCEWRSGLDRAALQRAAAGRGREMFFNKMGGGGGGRAEEEGQAEEESRRDGCRGQG